MTHFTYSDLLQELRARNIRLSIEGEALKVKAPKGAMTADLGAAIKQHKPELLAQFSKRSQLICINPGKPQGTNFFCVHGAGGNALFLKEWVPYLRDLSFYALESPGVDGTTDLPNSIEDMATLYIEIIRKNQVEGPYYLGGYSIGGVIALEMAQQLQKAGEEVGLLVLLDTYHPDIEPRHNTNQERLFSIMTSPFEFAQNAFKKKVSDPKRYAAYVKKVQTHIERGERLPIELREQYMEDHIDSIIADYETRSYMGEALLLCAAEVWDSYSHVTVDRGWARLIPNLLVHEIPGDHFSLISEPYVGQAVDALKDYIVARN